jgi:cobalt-zinc-cadmium efflux system membrane fusion protein
MYTQRILAQAAALASTGALLLFLAACGGSPAKEDGEEHHDEHAEGTEVALSREQINAIGLRTGPVEHRSLSGTLKANGRLMLPPQNEAQVSALMGGVVARIPVQEGEAVRQGQVLLEVASPDFLQLQQDYLESAAQVALKHADLERQRELRADNINAQRTFQEAEAAMKGADARYQGLREKLRLFGGDPDQLAAAGIRNSFSIRAPITGNLHHINFTMGQFVEPNKPLFSITDNHALHIDLTVFEQDVAKVREGQKVSFTIANDPHGAHDAVIFGVNKAFEQGQQAIVVHARMDNTEDQLLPGMFIDARIQVTSDSALCVPDQAIVSNGDDHYIFVEHEPATETGATTYLQVQVATGVTDQGYTEIKPTVALAADAQVVREGAYYLLSQLTKGSGEHDH